MGPSDSSMSKARLCHFTLVVTQELGAVYLLDLYISKLPPKAVENDVFYGRPLDKVPEHPSASWYSVTPVGKHTLSEKVKKMCNMAGIPGNKTNHSLRATGARQQEQHTCMRVVCLKNLYRKGQDTVH